MNRQAMPQRRSVRLSGWSYAGEAVYFITLCAYRRKCTFSHVSDSRILLTPLGKIIEEEWHAFPSHRPYLRTDAFVVMPNHMHGILSVHMDNAFSGWKPQKRRTFGAIRAGSLGAVMQAFKSAVTRRVRRLPGWESMEIWQRNYYEHIIRDMADYQTIRSYILRNPETWETDRLFSKR